MLYILYMSMRTEKGYKKRQGASTLCQAPILSASQLAWHISNWWKKDTFLRCTRPKAMWLHLENRETEEQASFSLTRRVLLASMTPLTCGSKSKDAEDIRTVKTPFPLLFSSQVRSWESVQRCTYYKQKHIFTWANSDIDVYNVFLKSSLCSD